MASIRSFGSLVPFTLPLGVNGFVVVYEELLELRFNFQVGTMNVKQNLYTECRGLKNNVDGLSWTLGSCSYRVIGIYDSQMQASTIILTNNSGTSAFYIAHNAIVTLEPSYKNFIVLLDS